MEPTWPALLLLGALWAAWGAVHSLLASAWAKDRLRSWLGPAARAYRLGFNVVAGGSFLVPLALLGWLSLPWEPLVVWGGLLRPVQVGMLVAAAGIAAAAALRYDLLDFAGVRQLVEDSRPATQDTLGDLSTRGVHGLVRHPWYLATLLLLWGRDLDAAGLVTSGVLTAYVVVGTLLEERKLAAELGLRWQRYRERVPMLLPAPWRLRSGR